MSEQNNGGVMPQQDAVKANWDVLSTVISQTNTPTTTEPEKKEDPQTVDTPEGTPKPPEVDIKAEEKPEPTDAEKLAAEIKDLGLKDGATKEEIEAARAKKAEEQPPVFEFKPEDIEGAPKTYEDGTFQALAQEMGYDLPVESFDAFKDSFVHKSEVEKIAQQTKESLFAQIEDANVAAALKLKELGIPDELVLEPTRAIDNNVATIEGYLKLSNAELIREQMKAQGATEDIINTKMESLIADGKIDAQADVIRFDLNKIKEQNLAQRQHILATKDQLIQQYTEQKKNAEAQRVIQEKAQVKEAFNAITDFLGIPVSKEVKDTLIRKFDTGAYDNDFKSAAYKAEYILKKELGGKYAEIMRNKFLTQGREEWIKKQSNVPEVKTVAVSHVDMNKQLDNNWAGLPTYS